MSLEERLRAAAAELDELLVHQVSPSLLTEAAKEITDLRRQLENTERILRDTEASLERCRS